MDTWEQDNFYDKIEEDTSTNDEAENFDDIIDINKWNKLFEENTDSDELKDKAILDKDDNDEDQEEEETDEEEQEDDDEVVTVIRKTYNYDKFKLLKCNRKLNQVNVQRLIHSFTEEQLLIPLLCNQNYEVIDGQHRLSVCKTLGKPVYYYKVNGYGMEQVKRANAASHNWTLNDHINAGIQNGNKNYLKFKSICDDYNISAILLIQIVTTLTPITQREFRASISEQTLNMSNIDAVYKFLEDLQLFKSCGFYTTGAFVKAFMKIYKAKWYSHEKMIKKFDIYGYALERRADMKHYVTLLLNDVYSKGSRKPIYYDEKNNKFYYPN